MRTNISNFGHRAIRAIFAAALCLTMVPAAAFAEVGDGQGVTQPSEATMESPSGSPVRDDSSQGADEGVAAANGDDLGTPVLAGAIINEEAPLDTVIAQAESTKSFFLAQTLESTRTVPMVSAKLPIDSGTDGKDAGSGEDAEGIDPDEGVSAGSTVVGAFEQNGMTFAIEADGGSVALMAVDYAKLPRECVSKQVVVIPETVSSDGIDSFSVARIGSGAFSSLKKESADPAFAGCEALFSDEELLVEAGMDPSEVEGFLSDDDAASAMQDDEEAIAPSDAQAGAGVREDGSGPSVEEGVSAGPDGAEKVRAIVSVEGDVATLDDGSTYEFKNPLAGCAGILAAYIPASVSSIEDDAFSGSDTLQYLVVSDDNKAYASFDGALYSADLATLRLIPEGRVGAVRIASSATECDPEVFSHCPSVDALVADADSAAFSILEARASAHSLQCVLSVRDGFGSEAKRLNTDVFGLTQDEEGSILERNAGGLKIASNFPVKIPAYVFQGDTFVQGRDFESSGFNQVVVGPLECSLIRVETEAGVPYIGARTSNWDGMAGQEVTILFKGFRCTLPGWYWNNKMTLNGSLVTDGVYFGDQEFWIGFSPTSYSVEFEAGGGTTAPASLKDLTSNDVAVFPFPSDSDLIRIGYSFAGWGVGSAVHQPGESCSMSTLISESNRPSQREQDTIVVTAQWTPNAYQVSFNANGGSGGQSANVTATYDAAMPAISTAKPVRAGYAFSGWYDTNASSGGTQYYTASCASARTWNKTGPATLYARWAPVTYGISYDDAGGSFSGKTGSYTIESNDFALPTSGMRTGFTFAGWEVTGASGSGIEGNGTTNVTVKKGTYGNLAAKAKWTINVYHLSWNVSHGTHANRTEDFTVEDCPIAMGEAVPDAGYSFLGWSGTGIAEGSASFALTDSMLEGRGDGETFAYVASFAANPYTARLHANDGTGEGGLGDTVEHAVTYDAAVSPASVPKRYGYAFSGYWTKGADGSKEELYFDEEGSYVRGDVWKDPSDIDLYACWTLMANLEVPVNAPSAVSFTVDRALEIGDGASGTQAGPSVTGALRSSVPQEVPIASIELEPLQDADGTASASRVLGEGNPERCGVEVSLGSSSSALLRLADATGAPLRWEPPSPLAIPAAVPVASGTTGEDVTSDSSGNLARMGELSLTYAMKLFSGFDVYRMPAEDASSEPVARIVFTVDLTGLEHEEF